MRIVSIGIFGGCIYGLSQGGYGNPGSRRAVVAYVGYGL